jgi:hypothetical protein
MIRSYVRHFTGYMIMCYAPDTDLYSARTHSTIQLWTWAAVLWAPRIGENPNTFLCK